MSYTKYKEEYLSGVSLEKIGQKYHICPYRLGKALKKDGIVIIRHNQKHNYNSSIFELIDSEEKAYWLGFLFADGYISKNKQTLEVGLSEIDKSHLEKLRLFFGGGLIRKKSYKKYKILCQHKPSRAEMREIISAENIGNPEMGIRPEG
jgi:hypothetical protein